MRTKAVKAPTGNNTVRIEKIENGYLSHHQPGDYSRPAKTFYHPTDPLKNVAKPKGKPKNGA